MRTTSGAKRWAVIGGGPCGVASTARLVDKLPSQSRILWVDNSNFASGRMGKYYRNVPANTLNVDLKYALSLCPSFHFEEKQAVRKGKNENTLIEMEDGKCASLGYFVDAVIDATEMLKTYSMVEITQGHVTSLEKFSREGSWALEISLQSGDVISEEVDGVIYACGGNPIVPFDFFPSASSVVHHMDLMVNPSYVKDLFASEPHLISSAWGVVGNSHSGVLILKNLIENGASSVTCVSRSPMKFEHSCAEGYLKNRGTGLKGPVADWARDAQNMARMQQARYRPELSWDEQFRELGVAQVVFAVGFSRDKSCAIRYLSGEDEATALDIYEYDRFTGEMGERGSNLFGAGIAFPQDYIDGGGEREPWVGFKRSIEQVDLMMAAFAQNIV